MKTSPRLWGLLCLLVPGLVSAQDFTGTFAAKSQGTVYTLVLRQDAQGKVSGTLSGTNGRRYDISAELEDEIAVGLCRGASSAYFEAELEGNAIRWTMFELGADNNPDFSKETNLDFVRQSGTAPAAPTVPTVRQDSVSPVPEAPKNPTRSSPPVTSRSAAITDAEMSISFTPPSGWKAAKRGEAYILGSDQYKGFMLIMPHSFGSLDQMGAGAQEGFVDEGNGIQLMPASGFKRFGNNGLSAEFSGVVQGTSARAYAVGLISPHGGGGVTILAAVESGSYTGAYPQFVETLAASLTFAKPQATARQGDASLMQYFAGKYYSYSGGSTIYGSAGTERRVTLCPDGLFFDSSEFSASGQGDVNWGGARSGSGTARWSIRGNKTGGTITIIRPNGRAEEIPYQVGESKGVIFFNGIKFAYEGAPECR